MKNAILIITTLIATFSAQAQRDTALKSNWELGMNLSQLISTVAGNKPTNIVDMPYTFILKYRTKNPNGAFRIGGSSTIFHKEDNSGGQTFRVTDERAYSPMLGFEWRRNLGNRFVVYGGVDARYISKEEQTVSTDFVIGGTNTIKGTYNGWGGGPMYGIMWNLNKHISLFTEGYLAGNWIRHHRTETFVG
ncbi:MAG: hypothetical protein EXR21_01230 [Flavobacteriaceae bacterium]|nr:hypothetical protein [Flavobacteriaceae bacterium]